MNILVIGSGGRESAMVWKIKQSPRVEKIFCAPGNAGTMKDSDTLFIESTNLTDLLYYSKIKDIDLAVVGPENPLCEGIVNLFKTNGIKIFGPDKKSAMLEKSKSFAKEFMKKYEIPTAKYEVCESLEDALEKIKDFTYPVVIKADGLCFGKGVFIPKSESEAKEYLNKIFVDKIFKDEGKKVVIEEYLEGIEASLMCSVTKGKIIPWESAKDYKKAFDNDEGPNTGGVGCYSPNTILTEDVKLSINDILSKIKYGLEQEAMDYRGILFIGFMITEKGPKILEFNVRLGDPETQVLLPRLKSDFVNICLKTIDGTLTEEDFKWDERCCVTTVLTSKGYPGKYEKFFEITGLDEVDEDIILFHNGTDLDNEGKTVTFGGRVISVTALGNSFEEARDKIYKNIEKINYEGKTYRSDIALF